MNTRDKIHSAINEHIDIEDTYAYFLTREKSSFSVRTVTLDDFEEWTDSDVADLTDSIMEKINPELNENQQVVLEWLQIYADKDSGDKPFQTIFFLWDCIKSNNLGNDELTALRKLTRAEQFQVIAAFAEWGMKQC
ncbi:hypothetical protein LIZ91_12135 [Enterococcus avium]|uniref:hypothetical protein n=1 Tax=Enterococcus avium TaxID=33945 RepID=UPI001D065566|nr:hypothetical protein [Enterococcus avium]MCB6917348.1 hypothetical protein [Enterococcus avium]MCQ4961059.1 hypothetical protein [Enterococcus avium]